MLSNATAAPESSSTHSGEPKRHVVGALLPFIGVILFLVATAQQFASEPGTNWGPVLVMNAVTYMIGWAGVGAGISHIFFGKRTSGSIGFGRSPYELEVGFADLAMGVVALLASSYSMDFALAIILTSSIFRVGCGIGHVRSMVQERNFAPNNTLILIVDFLVPAFLLFAYFTWA
jgi:hypothetical protein